MKNNIRLLFLAFIILLIFTGIYLFITNVDKTEYEYVKTDFAIQYETESRAVFYTNASSIYYCTKDGYSVYNTSGTLIHSGVYNMVKPFVTGEGSVCASGEPNGRLLYVFDDKQLLYNKNFDDTIVSFSVNKNGYSSVILLSGDHYKIKVFNNNGDEQWAYVFAEQNEYPVSAALSGDNKTVAIYSLDTNQLNINSVLKFARLTDSDFYARRVKENEMLFSIRFLQNNKLLAVSDKEICLFDEETVKSVYVPENELLFAGNTDKGFAIILGEPLLNKTGEKKGTVKLYSNSGALIGSYHADHATFLNGDGSVYVIGSGNSYIGVDTEGSELFRYSAGGAEQLYYLGKNALLQVSAREAVVLKRVKKVNEAKDDE